MSEKKKKILAMKDAPYTLKNGFMYKLGLDEILRNCALEHELQAIIDEAHSIPTRGNYQADMTPRKNLQSVLWWTTLHKCCRDQANKCEIFQRLGQPLPSNEMHLIPINPSINFLI